MATNIGKKMSCFSMCLVSFIAGGVVWLSSFLAIIWFTWFQSEKESR